ncbi:hypothetical protein [Chengkuizengella marina]|uniref:Uncharacterized protein n=1 Tax=Chengkuizengella marina TaxID=2507566 RepID=A0A6N9Q0F5_9BACL|nr:hypothetical protein [Chengkuizengella marina]NBI28602.1 hypothetical protein [Chengkuizengella marina]
MATQLEDIYDVFYSLVKIDLTKYPELDVNVESNIVEAYLKSALYEYEENLGQTLTIDGESIVEEIPVHHNRILGRLIYKNYRERELSESLQIANHFNKRSELEVTGIQSKIVALREMLTNIQSELNRSFTRNIMKGIN